MPMHHHEVRHLVWDGNGDRQVWKVRGVASLWYKGRVEYTSIKTCCIMKRFVVVLELVLVVVVVFMESN